MNQQLFWRPFSRPILKNERHGKSVFPIYLSNFVRLFPTASGNNIIFLNNDILLSFELTFRKMMDNGGLVLLSSYIEAITAKMSYLELNSTPITFKGVKDSLEKLVNSKPRSTFLTWQSFLDQVKTLTLIRFEPLPMKHFSAVDEPTRGISAPSQSLSSYFNATQLSKNGSESHAQTLTVEPDNSQSLRLRTQMNQLDLLSKGLSSSSSDIEARIEARMDSAKGAKPTVDDIMWSSDEDDASSLSATTEQLKSSRFTPLTAEEDAKITGILRGPDNNQVLTEKFNIDMTRAKIICLKPATWLNDEVINFYLTGLLQQRDTALCALHPERKRTHFFNSFFMEKLIIDSKGYNYANIKRWSKKFDVFTLNKVIVPINLNNSHWALVVAFVEEKEIKYYDSLGGDGSRYTQAMLNWLVDEAKEKKGFTLDTSDWKRAGHRLTPRQLNGYDCGVFTIIAADFVSDDLPVNEESYNQSHMPFFRKKIGTDILRGELLYPSLSLR